MTNLDHSFVSGTFSDDEENEGVDNDRNPDDPVARDFLVAAENGNVEILKKYLYTASSPEIVNTTDKEGYTALHRASYGNHIQAVKLLLRNGANISAKTDLQWEPLHSCCRWNNVECAAILIAEGADVNAPSEGGQTPLHIAASHGACYDMIQLLLNHPCIDASLKNNSDETAADIARRCSKYRNVFEMVDPLLDPKNIDSVGN